MRILGLLNSNVAPDDVHIPREEMFPARMAAALGKAIGEEVEVDARSVWPDQRLAASASRWVREFKPELVVFSIPSFWFMYESTPVRLERKFSRPGRWIGKRFRKLAANPRLAHNRPFQWARQRTQRVLGGESWFSADTVIANCTDTILSVLRGESTYLVVFGPSAGEKWAHDAQHLERLVARRRKVDQALEAFCAQHHVEYWGESKLASIRDARPASLQGDDLHLDREGHRRLAEYQFNLSLGMVNRALTATRGETQLSAAR
jgi:hypothetical protein